MTSQSCPDAHETKNFENRKHEKSRPEKSFFFCENIHFRVIGSLSFILPSSSSSFFFFLLVHALAYSLLQ